MDEKIVNLLPVGQGGGLQNSLSFLTVLAGDRRPLEPFAAMPKGDSRFRRWQTLIRNSPVAPLEGWRLSSVLLALREISTRSANTKELEVFIRTHLWANIMSMSGATQSLCADPLIPVGVWSEFCIWWEAHL
jgi:hypothetical protein